MIVDGPSYSNINKYIKDMDMEDSVIMTGKISDEFSIAPWFLAADLIVAQG